MREAPELLARGLTWPEAPRWAQGSLWISDVHNFRLARIGRDGSATTVCQIEGRPSGMDFAADGSLLLATALGRELVVVDAAAGSATAVADLSGLAKAALNDLVTHPDGWSWVGDTGFMFGVDEPTRSGSVIAYHPVHGARTVAENLFFPNGMAISPDGSTLYLSETFGRCIRAFDIGSQGALGRPRLYAELPGSPDGLCLDAEGCLWVPLLFEGEFVRISPKGEVVERIAFPGMSAIACVLGGENRSTLFLCVCRVDRSVADAPIRKGEIHTVRAPASGAGRP